MWKYVSPLHNSYIRELSDCNKRNILIATKASNGRMNYKTVSVYHGRISKKVIPKIIAYMEIPKLDMEE